MANKYALCIGINDYPGTGSDLSGCVNDARDWGAVLRDKGFTVQTLLNSQATRDGILEAMQSIIGSAVNGDSIVFQFSGHGSYIPDEDGDEWDQGGVRHAWCILVLLAWPLWGRLSRGGAVR